MSEIGDKVFDNVCYIKISLIHISKDERRTVRKGVDLGGLGSVLLDSAQAGEGVHTIDVHSARPAYALSAWSAKGEGGIGLVLDLELWYQNRWQEGKMIEDDGRWKTTGSMGSRNGDEQGEADRNGQ